MNLYLIRHADAVPLGKGGVDNDADRPLTEKGLAQARIVATGLQRQSVSLAVLLTSPLLRAKQTAEGILRQWTLPAPELRVCEELAPGVKTRKLAKLLREFEGKSVGLVGHMPDLADHAAWLIGGKKAQLDIAKAGVAYITGDDLPGKGEGTLTWLVAPAWLER